MTPPDYDAAVHRQLGELVATSKSTQDALRRLEEALRRSEDKSDSSRAAMHRRLDEVVERVGKVERALSTVQDEVKEMRPVTDEVRRWKLVGIGALGMIGIGGIALGVSFADVLKRIGGLLTGRL
jgi:ElaB/YqjD/DUF883 family membrane-anchored ribosome-binding protein